MKADITRSTFDARKHYAAVLLQQGRVPLDADANEQADIVVHRQDTGTADLVGPCGAPMHNDGFRLVASAAALTATEAARPGNQPPPPLTPLAGGWDFYISAGHYYVDGIVCENERITPFSAQADFPDAALPQQANQPQEGTYLAYLDVWRRGVTALEDPSIRETALGGPDTATRSKTLRQVRVFRLGPAALTPQQANCLTDSADWNALIAAGTGRVTARAEPGSQATGPCIVAPGAGYRRLENQLYRLEVHTGGTLGTATFKWSRENGSVVARWLGQDGASDEHLLLASGGRDATLGFASGQWVELTDDTRELRGESGTLVQILKVEGSTLTIDPATATGPLSLTDFTRNPKVRRWDQVSLLQPADAVAFHDLEGGVQVRFAAGSYRAGDYWLIPARTNSGDIEWERDAANQPLALLPHGVTHHFCRLAIMRFDGTSWTSITDCRRLFPPVTELVTLDYVGGDGQEAMPGNPLPHPLQVRVLNGQWPVVGRRVRFTVVSGGGTLSVNQPVATTGPNGIAECLWTLGAATPAKQRVEAVLLDGAEVPVPGQILFFNANQSVASDVAYNPGNCPTLAGQTTVQAAIDRIAQVVSLYKVTGDGQVLLPNQALQPLVVQASSLCRPTQGIGVQWQILSGDGTINPAAPSTNAQGLTQASWTLGPGPQTQEVEARLVPAAGQVAVEPSRVVFTARRATEGEDPGFQIVGVRLIAPTAPLAQGMLVSPLDLLGGIAVECNAPVDPTTVRDGGDPNTFNIERDQPTCFLSVEVPYPLTQTDRADWSLPSGGQFPVIGYRPVILRAQTEAQGPVIVWRPPIAVVQWLQAVAFRLLTGETGLDRFLARFTIKGSFVTREGDPNQFLDGDSFRAPKNPFVELPSGNGRRGGDFELWFWIRRAPQISFLNIEPQSLASGQTTGTLNFTSGNTRFPVTVSLQSDKPAIAKVPEIIELPEGKNEVSFRIDVAAGTTQEVVTISAQSLVGQTSRTFTRNRTFVVVNNDIRGANSKTATESAPKQAPDRPESSAPKENPAKPDATDTSKSNAVAPSRSKKRGPKKE